MGRKLSTCARGGAPHSIPLQKSKFGFNIVEHIKSKHTSRLDNEKEAWYMTRSGDKNNGK